MKKTIRQISGKYVAVAPIAIMVKGRSKIKVVQTVVIDRGRGGYLTVDPVFFCSNDLEELRADLHSQIDSMLDTAVKHL